MATPTDGRFAAAVAEYDGQWRRRLCYICTKARRSGKSKKHMTIFILERLVRCRVLSAEDHCTVSTHDLNMSTEMSKSHIQFRMGTITGEVRTAEELDGVLQEIDSNHEVSGTQRSHVRSELT